MHQPGESPARYWGGTVEGNHGGQHRQLGSVVKGFQATRHYVYVAGDATVCYQAPPTKRGEASLPPKCSLVTRQVVFLVPHHFVVFDRVIAAEASYRKDWLLHTAEEPVITGKTFRADHGQGRMFCRTLLPEDATVSAVGGPGKEFWAAGKNWSIVAPTLTPAARAMMGQWRVEVTPAAPRKEDCFLHVIQVGGGELATMDPAELVQSGSQRGVRLVTPQGTWEVTFATQGDLAGHLKRVGGAGPIDVALAARVEPQSGIMAGRGPNP